MKDIIIIGSGPADLTAAIYTSRDRLGSVYKTPKPERMLFSFASTSTGGDSDSHGTGSCGTGSCGFT